MSLEDNHNSRKEFNTRIFNDLSSSFKNIVDETQKIYFYKIKLNTSNLLVYSPKISVVNENCIKTCLKLNKSKNNHNHNVGLLNMCSVSKLGGAVYKGMFAQEEEIYRSTNIFSKISDIHYPISNDQLLLTKNVKIIQCRSSKSYFDFINVKKEKCFIDIISIPSLRKPDVILKDNLEFYKNEEDFQIIYNKLESLFKTFILNNNIDIVIGAFGCGIYKNPINDVIKIFKSLLVDYSKFFNSITFSILDKSNENYLFDTFSQNFN